MTSERSAADLPHLRVSIITVAFNSAATIRDSIESVLSQDYPNIEYIVVDGDSQDGTVAIAREYESRIAHLVSEPDSGIYDAMNKGIDLSTGDVVAFLNSDDFYSGQDSVSRAMTPLRKGGVEASYADLCYVSPEDTTRVVRYWKSSPFKPGFFQKGWNPPHPTYFARRHVYDRFGTFDLRYRLGADIELMMRFMEVHRVRAAYVPHPLVHMRLGGATNESWRNIVRQNREIWHAMCHHGLSPSVVGFIGGKLTSRMKQFLSKPKPGSG